MELTDIKTLLDWNLEQSEKNGEDGSLYVFRGVSNKEYPSVPKISRLKNDEVVDNELGKERVKRLRQYLNNNLPAYGYDFHHLPQKMRLWRELFIAQHYGIPTNLLDFSRNPLVALFFACQPNTKNTDGLVDALPIRSQGKIPEEFDIKDKRYNIASYNLLSDRGEESLSPFEMNRYMFIVPPLFDQRIKAQNSIFCNFPVDILSNPLENLVAIQNIIDETKTTFTQFEIPHNKKHDTLIQLNKIGINNATLFPDISGFGDFVTWKILDCKD